MHVRDKRWGDLGVRANAHLHARVAQCFDGSAQRDFRGTGTCDGPSPRAAPAIPPQPRDLETRSCGAGTPNRRMWGTRVAQRLRVAPTGADSLTEVARRGAEAGGLDDDRRAVSVDR